MEMYHDLNGVPDRRAIHLDLHPEPIATRPRQRPPRRRRRRCREFLRPYRGYQNIRDPRQLRDARTTSRCRCTVNRPLHPRRAVRRGVHAATRAAASRTRIPATLVLRARSPARFLLLGSLTQSRPQQPDHQLLVGHSRPAQPGRLRPAARRLAGVGRTTSSARRLGATVVDDDDRQLRLHGRRRRATARDLGGRRAVPASRAAGAGRRPDGRRRRSADRLVQHRGVRAASARSDYGNAPRNVVQKPGSSTTEPRGLQERRLRRQQGALQFRAEIYNRVQPGRVPATSIARPVFDADRRADQDHVRHGDRHQHVRRAPPRVVQLSVRFNF